MLWVETQGNSEEGFLCFHCSAMRVPCPTCLLMQVWVGGQLWATTAEVSNVNSDLSYSIGLTRIAVTGIAYWQVPLGC